ncbi:MAG: DUF3990 domain-containing protein [Peptococcaceae bacterium]|nr:DUF3990 domain-containing protein [Peptococcaceae bacterium]
MRIDFLFSHAHSTNVITLYHGTTHDITKIDVLRGKPFKDFGQGFYTTWNRESAVNMALRNRDIELRRLARRGIIREVTAYLYTFEFDESKLAGLNVKKFDRADKEWVLFATDNRSHNPHNHSSDIVIGPTANDQTNPTIQTYLNEGYGTVGSDRAIEILIEFLEPHNLPYQYFFGTDRAANLLVLKGRRVVK